MSPKKMRKKGKAAPPAIAANEPMRSFIFSMGVVKEKRAKKGAGGIFLSS